MLGAVGGTYARVDGTIGSLTSGAPVYALDADVPAARVANTLHAFGLPQLHDRRIVQRAPARRRTQPRADDRRSRRRAGRRRQRVAVRRRAARRSPPVTAGVSIHQGSVLVGTTATRFTAVAQPGETEIDVNAPHADLSDFNNFFDTGDTLDGNGSVKIAADAKGSRVTSSGNIDVRGFRYRNLPIGDTQAMWSSAKNAIDGDLAVGGAQGMLRARGSIGLTPQPRLANHADELAVRSRRKRARISISRSGCRRWECRACRSPGARRATRRFAGVIRHLDLRGNARITGGTLGPLTLDRAELSLHTAGRRFVIDNAAMATPELAATASGTLGLSADAPLDVRVHATTDRLAQLSYSISRVRVPVSGSFESTLQIGGTYRVAEFRCRLRRYRREGVRNSDRVALRRSASAARRAGALKRRR